MPVSSNYKFGLVCALFVAIIVDNLTRPAPSLFQPETIPELAKEYISPLQTAPFAYISWPIAAASWIVVTLALLGVVVDSKKVILPYRVDQAFENSVAQFVIFSIGFNACYTLAQAVGQVRVAVVVLEMYVGLTARFFIVIHRRKRTRWWLRACVALTLAWASYGLCLLLSMVYGLHISVCIAILLVWLGQMLYCAYKAHDFTLLTMTCMIASGILV